MPGAPGQDLKSRGESLYEKMKFNWDLLPGWSSWLVFIKQHRVTEQEDIMFIILASEMCSHPEIPPRSKQIFSGLHCLFIPRIQSCSCLWTSLYQFEYRFVLWVKQEGAKEWTIRVEWWSSYTMKQRRRRGGSHERGQVQYHILPVRWLKRRAAEECLAPRGACGMLTTGWKNQLFRVRLFHAPYWVGKVSAK